jgi:CDGSH-type Zn-finger protein
MDANGTGLAEIGLEESETPEQFFYQCKCGNNWQGPYCDDTCMLCFNQVDCGQAVNQQIIN